MKKKRSGEFTFVSADDLETPEEYVVHLVAALTSLTTLRGYQDQALKKGFLNAEEMSQVEFIRYDIMRLMLMYQKFIGEINTRFNFDTTAVITAVQAQQMQQAKKLVGES